MRKALSAPGLLSCIRGAFQQIPETCAGTPTYSLVNVLMSVMAMFGLKCGSMLRFDEERTKPAFQRNLLNLYGVPAAPCDTQIRARLDPIDPDYFRPVFKEVHHTLQQQGALRDFAFMDGYYLLAIDGTGTFSSKAIHCDCCGEKHKTGLETEYYHQVLSAKIVHPDQSIVLPLAVEPIVREDGATKNDCERNAAKRLLRKIKADYPQMKFVVLADGLGGNGPHVELLMELEYSLIIVVKQDDHKALFQFVQKQMIAGKTEEFEIKSSDGTVRGYRFFNGAPLNKSYPHILVNYLDYWCVTPDGKEQNWIWITTIPLDKETAPQVAKGGLARWKIENEGFNTLKNHGYNLEHNYGHGKQYLATVFIYLIMLSFLVDQVEELSCAMFKAAREQFKSRTSLWDKIRGLFFSCLIESWDVLWRVIIDNLPGRFAGFDTS